MDSALSDPHNGSAEAGGPTNGTTRPPSTPEGIALAYGSLLLMALLPIFFGALRSVRCARGKNASDMPETITSRDAARFPIIASCTLLGLYLFFKIFSQEYINLLLSMYFFVLGILALSHTISPFMNKFFPANFPNRQYQLLFTQGSGENKEEIINYEFDTKDLVCLGLSSIVGVWYLLRKHWIANNLFGLAFSLNGVELLHLNNVSTGCILLGGLFIYDVFWVFGTNVMVTVAKSFEAPIKLVFPQDLLEKGLEADNFAMLGLGDIVIPGIFIALLLRFDISLKKNTHTYFYTSFAAYIFGLGLTIFIMHIFKHAQPALLYLVPACIGFPVLVALAKGEVTEMFSYESSAEILPHTPRLTHFPTVSGSPASLADSMQQKLAGPRRRRPQNPSAIGRFKKLKIGLHKPKPNLSSICRCPCHLLAPPGTEKVEQAACLRRAPSGAGPSPGSYEESNPKDPAAVTESKEGTETSALKGLEKKEK
ncbi:minor histocompatibility antigen H13 isoform X1 [Hippopotamus amphibius kiboko]|uniref:minor histocompatibility antigen H13 isoform X1 n=1 Tax=Hippopotamus amphibius kiboko TaxID=575201 RepID=UPI0025979955|nr:minor histocompatibility antigen H13 isoform X1 [Hippopotamus amphibius kiboko]